MRFQHFCLAAALALVAAGCSKPAADQPAVEGQVAPSPASPATPEQPAAPSRENVDFVELPLDGSSNQVQPLNTGQAVSGQFVAPRDGNVVGVEIQIGNYSNSSAGELGLKVCQAGSCSSGTATIAGSKDNDYWLIALAQPLAIAAGKPVEYVLTRTAGDNPFAVWVYPSIEATTILTLPGGEAAAHSLKMGLRFSH